jgi:hypothetical protein
MNRMILLVILAFIGAGLIGACGPRQFTTLTIYDKPAAYVRLEFDWRVKKGSEHSHPIVLTRGDYVVADTQDDRHTPMASLTKYGGHLDFEPQSTKWERSDGGFEGFFRGESRELAILYEQLPSQPLVDAAPKSVAVP